MITHLKDRKYYEDLYDKITVDIGRREAGSILRAREEFLSKAKITNQEKPVRENERRVRVDTNFKDAVKEMSKSSPMTNKDVTTWVKEQREETENLENDK